MNNTNSTVTKLYCPKCAKTFSPEKLINLCECGLPLLVDYDYKKAAGLLKKESLPHRISTMWKYREVLPVLSCDNIISLGEGGTPLQASVKIGGKLGLKNLYFKDESNNPTGSFKARGLGMAVSKAKELGVEKIIIPTAGNAGSALAAYCAKAGISAKVIMTTDVPSAFITDCRYHGAEIEQVEGTIKNCGERAAQLVKEEGWFAVSTLKEPYRIEGKKTMGYELAEQLNFELPDVIIYPTGGGTGLIGMWKAFDEMEKLGWIGSKRPRMVSVQAEDCAPIVRAFENKAETATLWENPHTDAAGLRVPSAIGDFLILEALYQSNGQAVAVSEKEIFDCSKELANSEGIFPAPEGGASLAALKQLLERNLVDKNETVVVFNTGSGYKYLDVLAKHWKG